MKFRFEWMDKDLSMKLGTGKKKTSLLTEIENTQLNRPLKTVLLIEFNFPP